MKNSTISKQWSYTTDLYSTNAYKSHKLSMLWLMLLTLLLVPTRMVALTTTEDPRYDLFKDLEGITDVTISDKGSYPWQMLDLNADGMSNVSSYFTKESKGLMSSNYKQLQQHLIAAILILVRLAPHGLRSACLSRYRSKIRTSVHSSSFRLTRELIL